MYHWWHYRYQELCTTNYSFSPSNLMEWLQSYPLISSIECQILSYNLENILSDLLKHKFIDPEYFQVVSTSTGIKVFWDGSHRVEIKIPESLQSKVCGLCGDFNKVRNDDWRIGNSCPEEGRLGEIVSSQSNSQISELIKLITCMNSYILRPCFYSFHPFPFRPLTTMTSATPGLCLVCVLWINAVHHHLRHALCKRNKQLSSSVLISSEQDSE